MSQASEIASRKKPGRITKATQTWIAVGGLALVCLAGAAIVFATPYRRYVSPPLPGGVRYTFLYPRRLQWLQESGPDKWVGVQGVQIDAARPSSAKPTMVDLLCEGVNYLFPRRGLHPPERVFTRVIVAAPELDGSIRDRRREYPMWMGNQWLQTLNVVDAHTCLDIDVRFLGGGTFKQDSTVLVQSFRILARGEEPP